MITPGYYNTGNANYQTMPQPQVTMPSYPQMQSIVPMQTAPQQNNEDLTVKSREEAFYYPVGPGITVRFIKEDKSAIYIKSNSGAGPEPFTFEEYVKVEENKPVQNEMPDYQSEIDKIWGEINALKSRQKPQNYKRREDGNNRNV